MAVIAKFKVTTIDLLPWGGWDADHPKTITRRVNMSAVKSEPFANSTPQGSVMMVIVNPQAAEQFELEAEYEVTFTRVSDGLPVKIG